MFFTKKCFFIIIVMLSLFILGCSTDGKNGNNAIASNVKTELLTITFDSQGGSSVADQQVEKGGKITKPDDPTKEEFEFLGWYYVDQEWSFIGYVATEDMTLVAKWKEKVPEREYVTVTFDSQGGSKIENQILEIGSKISKPIDPTKEDYEFDGWYVGDEKWSFVGHIVTEDITLTAKWLVEVGYTGTDYQTKVLADGTIEVTKYVGKDTNAIIPRIINRHFVTKVGDYAFFNCSSLLSIILPDSVTSIGEYAFEGCRSLDNVFYLGTESEWKTIYVATGNENLSAARNIEFNSQIASLVSVNDGKWEYVITNMNEIYSLICLDKEVVSVNFSEFNNYKIKSLNNEAFMNCSSLKSITIPDSITNIGNSAFYYCSSLTSITIPDSVTIIGKSAFHACKSLTSVTIPSTLTGIGYEAFMGCSSLTSIKIPDSVTVIGSDAFWGCSSLTSITIPNSVTSIYDGTFIGCSSLTSITIPGSVISIGNSSFKACSSLASVTIPDSVTSIGASAFSDCTSLTSITIPDSVTVIGGGAFYKCPIEEATIPAIACSYIKNSKLKTVVINGGTYISSSAFYGCSSLTSITIPDSVTNIGYEAFRGCSSLTSITIPDSVTSIGNNAFSGCTSLTIYCIAQSKPSGWDSNWNNGRPVIWGYKKTR